MKTWNVPLEIIATVKALAKTVENKSTLNYGDMIDVLSQNEIPDTEQNAQLLTNAFSLLQDVSNVYHMMNLEAFVCENTNLTKNEKVKVFEESLKYKNLQEVYKKDINKRKLLFLEMIKYISFTQMDELLILKYQSEVSFYDLWNEFYMETRGVVIDLENLSLVTAPYRKFFNYNEKYISSEKVINEALKKSIYVSIKSKEDGSLISVSKYKDSVVVTTPGSFYSEQAVWAKFFLSKNHSDFMKEIEEDKTFLFEGIYPTNRVVVNYDNAEKLVLTNIRDKTTGELLPDEKVKEYADKYGFETALEFSDSLENILTYAKDKENYPANKVEGWVFKIQTESETIMFKVKCDDYCEIHNAINVLNSPKIVLKHILTESYDDFLSKVPDVIRPDIEQMASVIFDYMYKVKKDVMKYLHMIPNEILFTADELKNHQVFKEYLTDNIVPAITDKLSKNMKTTLREGLISKAYGKNVTMDKYTQTEFEKLWNMIPDELRNQQSFKKKEGQLLGFMHKSVPKAYHSVVIEYAKTQENTFLTLIDIKDIDFGFIHPEVA